MTCVSLLAYPCEVDCAGQNVDIHEVVDDPTLDVTCNRNRHELRIETRDNGAFCGTCADLGYLICQPCYIYAMNYI